MLLVVGFRRVDIDADQNGGRATNGYTVYYEDQESQRGVEGCVCGKFFIHDYLNRDGFRPEVGQSISYVGHNDKGKVDKIVLSN